MKPEWQTLPFYAMYALCTLGVASLVLVPEAPLQLIIVWVQVLAGIILPSAIIFLQIVLNDRQLLGDRWVNRQWNNLINWTIIIVLFCLAKGEIEDRVRGLDRRLRSCTAPAVRPSHSLGLPDRTRQPALKPGFG